MMKELDYTFRSMGSDIRFLIGSPMLPGAPSPLDAADRERAFVLDFAQRLSRFRTDSELSRLNHDPATTCRASALLRAALGAGLWAAQRSGGLVEPTLVGALERTGYSASMDRAEPASLLDALRDAPARRPAAPARDSRWREVVIDDERSLITRPRGVMLDTGGTGKGLCADAVARRLGAYTRFVVDCGGDMSVGGVDAQLDPYEIEIEHPLTHSSVGVLRVGRGGVATSGLNVRIWRDREGRFCHHLLDPSTGRPAWTGLIGVTALGSCALEAETLSKLALLLGPAGARDVLEPAGGVIVHDSGEVEAIGQIDGRIHGRELCAGAR